MSAPVPSITEVKHLWSWLVNGWVTSPLTIHDAARRMALLRDKNSSSAICYGKRGLTEPLNQETNSVGWELVLSAMT